MRLQRAILGIVCLGSAALAQNGQETQDPPSSVRGTCGGATAIQLPPDITRLARMSSGALQIVPQWDASVLALNDENYNIQSTANQLGLKINGVLLPTIALTTGVNRTAQQIADELNAVPEFSARATATPWAGRNAYAPPAALYIRSQGVTFGSIEVLAVTNSAHGVLGLTLGFKGPDADAARRTVFLQAFNDWESVILHGGNILSPYTARVGYAQAVPGGSAASGGPIRSWSGGSIVGAVMDFDSSETWFEDPTPGDDSEFASAPLPPGLDLLTFARHELGHALGWIGNDGLLDLTTTLTVGLSAVATAAVVSSTEGFLDAGRFTVDGELIDYTSKTDLLLLGLTRGLGGTTAALHVIGSTVVCDNVYDRTRLNVAVLDGGAHTHPTYHPGDIMVPAFGGSMRVSIAPYPAMARPSRGQFSTVPLAVLDPSGSLMPDGRASAPWPDLTSAASAAAAGIPFLLTDGVYNEPVLPLAITDAHEFLLVRDASVLVR